MENYLCLVHLVYIVDKTKLLNGDVLSYEFLGAKKGLRIALTPNSWNYMDEQDNLYMSGNVGVVCMNLNHYNISTRSYRMLLQSIKVDGKTYFILIHGAVISWKRNMRRK